MPSAYTLIRQPEKLTQQETATTALTPLIRWRVSQLWKRGRIYPKPLQKSEIFVRKTPPLPKLGEGAGGVRAGRCRFFFRWPSILLFLKILALLPALLLGACSPVQEVVPIIGEPTPAPELLRITGANTMVPLVRELAHTYTRQQPQIIIEVTGGGSTWGLQAVNKGQAEIAMLSRPLKGNEHLSENGLPLLETAIARDGIALIIHPSNPINRLDPSQVSDILSGHLFEWDELGWLAGQIEVVSREAGSGDRAMIEQTFLSEGQGLTLNAVVMPDSAATISYVAKTPTAIGYVAIPHLSGTVKALRLGDDEPTLEALKDGSYPIARELFMVTNGVPKGEISRFIEWIQGAEGQSIIERRYVRK